MNSIKRILTECLNNFEIKFFCVCTLIILSTVMDMISIGSLTMFISILFNKELIFNLLKKYIPEGYLLNITDDNILIVLSVSIIIVFILKNLISFFINWFEISFIKEIRVKKTEILFNKYLNMNFELFLEKNFAYLQRAIFNEVFLLTTTLSQIVVLIREMFLILGIMLLLFITNLKITLYIFGFLLLISFLFYIFTRKVLKLYGQKSLAHRVNKHKTFNEFGSFFKEIKIFNLKIFFRNKFINEVRGDENNKAYGDIISKAPKLIFETICISMILLIFIYIQLNNLDFRNYIPLFSLFSLGLVRMLPSFNQISQVLSRIKINEASSINILNDMMFNKIKIKNKNKNEKNYIYKFHKEINISSINFDYGNKKVLKNLSLKIKKNKIICLYGESGSGKSTLLNIISGLIIPKNGRLYCDDVIIAQHNVENWQKQMISFMGQESFILNTNLKNNIDLNNTTLMKEDEERMREMIKNLRLDKKFSLDYIFNSNMTLSGGEKQRIGFARALYKNSPILLLDEPTNNLDKENEDILIGHINDLKGKKTIIIATHNLRFKEISDEVINLDV